MRGRRRSGSGASRSEAPTGESQPKTMEEAVVKSDSRRRGGPRKDKWTKGRRAFVKQTIAWQTDDIIRDGVPSALGWATC